MGIKDLTDADLKKINAKLKSVGSEIQLTPKILKDLAQSAVPKGIKIELDPTIRNEPIARGFSTAATVWGFLCMAGMFLWKLLTTKKPRRPMVGAAVLFGLWRRLFADAELFLSDDGTVAGDVFAHEVVEQTTTLTYQHLKSAFGCMIFVI